MVFIFLINDFYFPATLDTLLVSNVAFLLDGKSLS